MSPFLQKNSKKAANKNLLVSRALYFISYFSIFTGGLILGKLLIVFLVSLYSVSSFSNEDVFLEEKETIQYGDTKVDVIAKRTLLHNDKTDRYSVKNLFDDNLNTAWVTRQGKNSSFDYFDLQIELPTPEYIRSISFANGYQKSDSVFRNNQRVMLLKISTKLVGHEDYSSWLDFEYELKDSVGFQEIYLEGILPFKVSGLKVRINKIFESEKYDDLCISEFKLNFEKENPYIPNMKYDEFVSLLKKEADIYPGWSGVCWDFNREFLLSPKNTNTHNSGEYVDKIMSDLYYYAIIDKEGYRDLYRGYCPQGSASLGWLDFLVGPAMSELIK